MNSLLLLTLCALSSVGCTASTCTMYTTEFGNCDQCDLDCNIVIPPQTSLKAAWKAGTCMSQGFPVKKSTATKHFPIFGDVTITTYTKPATSLRVSPVEMQTFKFGDQTCQAPGHCGKAYQVCCGGEAAQGTPCACHLQDAVSAGGTAGSTCGICGGAFALCCSAYKLKGFPCTCDAQPAPAEALKAEVKTLLVDAIVEQLPSLDAAKKAISATVATAVEEIASLVMPVETPAVQIDVQTCEKPGHCGRAYQTCCAGFAAKSFPCACHLQDASPGGEADKTCGICGTGYAACCAGYKAKGLPCDCDVQPEA